ncbi:MAG: transposase [Nitrospira sp.]|nr:transposase [Nitrospira sp.]
MTADKQGRGYRQFLLRGMRQVRGEWALICTTHNVLKLWRALAHRPRGPGHRLRMLCGSRKANRRRQR